MATGFAAGLAQGLGNGMALYNAYEKGQKLKHERKVEEETAEAMKKEMVARGLDPETDSPMMLAAGARPSEVETVRTAKPTVMQSQAAGGTQDGGAAQAFPVAPPSEPTMGSINGVGMPQDASGQAAGLQGAPAPGLAMVAQQDRQADALGLGKKKGSPDPQQGLLSGGEFGDMAESLTRGIRKALELGAPGKAMELLVMREKTIGQYRDQAFGEAMSRFDLTGDPNSFLPFVNRFAPTGIELQSIETRPETAGGQPVYIAHGINHETGQPVQQPFSHQTFTKFLGAIGDGAAYRTMFAEQAKHWYDMENFKEKETFKADEGIRRDRSRHGMNMSEIGARGAERRKTNSTNAGSRQDASTADIRNIEYLVSNGIAKDGKSAWEMLRGAKTKSREDYVLEQASKILSENRKAGFGTDKITPQQAKDMADELYDAVHHSGGASEPSAGYGATQGPGVGDVVDGYRFKGGNPNDQGNWEEM